MFVKAKFKLWIAILILCSLLSQVPGIIAYITRDIPVTQYSVGFDMDDTALKNRVAGKEIVLQDNKVSLSVNNTNQDFIIAKKNDKNLYDGYEKLNGYLYTPIIMFINTNLSSYKKNFTIVNQESGKAYMKDIRYLLQAIEEDKTWEDIGIDEHLIGKKKEAVTLIVPSEYDETYQDIRNYFVMVLNDFKAPSGSDLPDLQARVDNILKKCRKQEDISGILKGCPLHKGIFVCKESVISENLNSFKNGFLTSPYYYEVSPVKTMNIEYDVYVKKEKVDEIKQFLQSVEFLELFGLRNTDSINNIMMSPYYERCFKVIDDIEMDTTDQAK